MTYAYYNEIDPKAVAALEQLIREGVIAPGFVDTRSIEQVQAHELQYFTQWHFFAGGGIWSAAARGVGWPDDRPLGTASCPCQPFSAAGQQQGTNDPRHLWPHVHRIVRAARLAGFCPPVWMGEQVAGKAGYDWFDRVRASLAHEGIAARVVDIPACAVDAPHERNRQYWCAVADAMCTGRDACTQSGICRCEESTGTWNGESQRLHGSHRTQIMADAEGEQRGRVEPVGGAQRRTVDGRVDANGNMVDADVVIVQGQSRAGQLREHESHGGAFQGDSYGSHGAIPRALGHAERAGWQGFGRHGFNWAGWAQSNRPASTPDDCYRPNGSWWADAEWIECHDGKARRAKPGVSMLVDGMVGRSALWSLAGNSIVLELAKEVIASYLDAESAASAAVSSPASLIPPPPY